MNKVKQILKKYTNTSLMLRIFIGLVIGAVLGLFAPSWTGIGNDVAMQAVAIGFIIGVVQDSVETALNSSGDVFFTATAEYYDRKKKSPK